MKFANNLSRVFNIVAVVTVVSVILFAILYTPGADPTRVYYGSDTRLFSIWMGSALAFVWPTTHLKKDIPVKSKRLLNIVGLVSLAG